MLKPENKGPPFKFVVAVGIGSLFGVISLNLAPFTIGAFIDDLGITQARSGFLVTAELVVIGLSAILISPTVNKIGIRRTALLGIIIAITGQLASLLFEQFGSLLTIRLFTAMGLGLVYASANAAGGRAKNPDAVFSLAITCSLIVVALFLPGIGAVVGHFGYRGIVLAVAAFLLISAPTLIWLVPKEASSSTLTSKADVLKTTDLFLLIAMIAFFNVGTGAAWTFMERVGIVKLGLPSEQVGLILGMGTFAGIFGALSVSWLSKRVGRLYPIIAGLSIGGISSFFIVSGLDIASYIIGGLLFWGSYMLIYPYSIALGSDLDKSDRGATIAAGMTMMSFAVGPMVGAQILTVSSFYILALFCFGSCLLAAIISLPLIRSLNSR